MPGVETVDSSNHSALDASVTALVVVDHGSRREEANAVLTEVVTKLGNSTGGAFRTVTGAHMDVLRPSIGDAVDECVAAGAGHLVFVPLFLVPGRHSQEDIPRLAALAAERYPGLALSFAEPIGADVRLIDVLLDRARAACS